MKNIALILQHRPDTKLHIENYSDPADGSIHIHIKLQDARTSENLESFNWIYDLEDGLRALDYRCENLAKRWRKPLVNTGVR